MNIPPWHVLLPAMFGVGLTVYIASQISDEIGWLYVLILLLGMMIAYKSFATEFNNVFGHNLQSPQRAPGQTTGPF